MPINIHKRHHKMVGDNKRTPLIVKAIQQKIKKGDVIFEIGCGTGILTLEALKTGAGLVYACDIDPEAIRAELLAALVDQLANFGGLECADGWGGVRGRCCACRTAHDAPLSNPGP